MEAVVVIVLVSLFLKACRHFYLSLMDHNHALINRENRLRSHLSSHTAQSLLFELDDMHNEPDFVMQCERHSIWKKKVRAYVENINTAKADSNVIVYDFDR